MTEAPKTMRGAGREAQAAEHPDAKLLASFMRWKDAEASYAALLADDLAADSREQDEDDEVRAVSARRDREMQRLVERLHALRTRIARCSARTTEGLLAKAEVVFRWLDHDSWAELDPSHEDFLAMELARDVIVFCGGEAEMREWASAGRKARRAWERERAARLPLTPSPHDVEWQERRREAVERFAALGLHRDEGLTSGEVQLGVWLARRLRLAGEAEASRHVVELLGIKADWVPAELQAELGLAWKH